MAVRKMSLAAWQKACATTHAKPSASDLNGDSPGAVAAKLGISRQAVHQAVARGDLDAIIVNDSRGKLLMFMIPTRSIEAFAEKRKLRQRYRA